ncbi:MAG: hypothetical protein HGA45_01935 [Chloroflexales bacterium]|nr:hypothetical protein [Chloroflexales bacterium]
MQTDTQEWRMFMNEAAYSLIREQAPNELPLYVKTRDRYFADPAGFTAQPESVDRPLGMGSVEMIHTFSQTVFPLIGPMVSAIAATVATSLHQEVTDAIVEKVRKLFTKPEPAFTQPQLETIATTISAVIKIQQPQLRLDPAQAKAVETMLIARLALAKTQ